MKRLAAPICVFFSLAAFLACVGDEPTASNPDGSDAGADSAAGEEGGPAACATPARCSEDGTSLVTCNGAVPCGLGCDVANARCKSTAPSGAAGQASTSAATAATVLDAASIYWFDTSTGIIGFRDDTGTPTGAPLRAGGNGVVSGIGFEIVAQSDGSKIGVWSFRSLTVGKSAVVRVFGVDALALVAQDSLVIDGSISVAGDCVNNVPGPGAAAAASDRGGKAGDVKLTNPGFKYGCSGGGGGGNGTAGGEGAWASVISSDGVGSVQALGGGRGTARAKTLIDEPLLVGGGTGGRGGDSYGNDPVINGGVGGGAVQLVSSGTLVVSGLVDAAGCGGKLGWGGTPPINQAYCRGSGGGGAGGAILLEAPTVRLTGAGRVLANGGGGGGGTSANSSKNAPALNTDGASNGVDGARAAGGVADASRASSCGPGQRGNVPGDGTEPYAEPCAVNNVAAAASGGGGGAGTIGVRTSDASFATDDGGIVSPPANRSIIAVK